MAYSMPRRFSAFLIAGATVLSFTGCKEDNPSSPKPPTTTVVVPANHETKPLDELLGDVGIKYEQEFTREAAAKAEQERIVQQKLEAAEKQAAPYLKKAQEIIAELGPDPKGNYLKIEVSTDREDLTYTLKIGVVEAGKNSFYPFTFEFNQDGHRWPVNGDKPYSMDDFTYGIAFLIFKEMPSHPKIEGIVINTDWSSAVPANPVEQSAGQPITLMQWLTYFKERKSCHNWREQRATEKRQQAGQVLIEKTKPFAAPYLAEIEKIAAYGADAEGRAIKVTQVVDLQRDGYYIEVRRVDPKDTTWGKKQPAFYLSFGLNGNQPYFETRPRQFKSDSLDLSAYEPSRPDNVPPYGIGNFQTDLAAWMVKAMYTNSHVQQTIAEAKTRRR